MDPMRSTVVVLVLLLVAVALLARGGSLIATSVAAGPAFEEAGRDLRWNRCVQEAAVDAARTATATAP